MRVFCLGLQDHGTGRYLEDWCNVVISPCLKDSLRFDLPAFNLALVLASLCKVVVSGIGVVVWVIKTYVFTLWRSDGSCSIPGINIRHC